MLLAKGKIKPSAEAIYNALRRAPHHLSRARYGIYLAVDSLYWAMVDSSHAALMIANRIAPSPEHIPEMLEQYFVKRRMLDKKYAISSKNRKSSRKNEFRLLIVMKKIILNTIKTRLNQCMLMKITQLSILMLMVKLFTRNKKKL